MPTMGIFYFQKPPIGTQGNNKISKSLFWGSNKQKRFFSLSQSALVGLNWPKLALLTIKYKCIIDNFKYFFDNFDIDHQMLINLGLYEPFYRL